MATLEERSSRRRRFSSPTYKRAALKKLCLSLWLRFIKFTVRKEPSNNTNAIQIILTVLILYVKFNKTRSTKGPFYPTSRISPTARAMASSQHDPVFAQLERQKLTASPP